MFQYTKLLFMPLLLNDAAKSVVAKQYESNFHMTVTNAASLVVTPNMYTYYSNVVSL